LSSFKDRLNPLKGGERILVGNEGGRLGAYIANSAKPGNRHRPVEKGKRLSTPLGAFPRRAGFSDARRKKPGLSLTQGRSQKIFFQRASHNVPLDQPTTDSSLGGGSPGGRGGDISIEEGTRKGGRGVGSWYPGGLPRGARFKNGTQDEEEARKRRGMSNWGRVRKGWSSSARLHS